MTEDKNPDGIGIIDVGIPDDIDWTKPAVEEESHASKKFEDAGKSQERSQQKRRVTECIARTTKNIYRRAFSETQLLDAIGLKFEKGTSYHLITAGDVDQMSYLKLILRHQPLDYCLFSTWCMNGDDVLQLEEWLEAGRIKRIDGYLGEIFPGSYRMEWRKLIQVYEQYKPGRLAVFRNHAKVFAGTGPEFSFVVETSANISTNPRTENGCITIDDEIFRFYKKYFDGIVSFDTDWTRKHPETKGPTQ